MSSVETEVHCATNTKWINFTLVWLFFYVNSLVLNGWQNVQGEFLMYIYIQTGFGLDKKTQGPYIHTIY